MTSWAVVGRGDPVFSGREFDDERGLLSRIRRIGPAEIGPALLRQVLLAGEHHLLLLSLLIQARRWLHDVHVANEVLCRRETHVIDARRQGVRRLDTIRPDMDLHEWIAEFADQFVAERRVDLRTLRRHCARQRTRDHRHEQAQHSESCSHSRSFYV
jgi:hypothetical protein